MARKFWYYTIVILCATLTGCDHNTKVTEQVNLIINQVKEEFCPDSRLDYFNITGSPGRQSLVLRGETSNRTALDSLVTRLNRLTTVTIINESICLPHPILGDSIYGVILRSVAPQRRKPDITSELVNEGIMGDVVLLLKREFDGIMWYYTQMEDGYLGWIWSTNFVRMNKQQLDTWKAKPKLIVTATFAQAFAEPDDGSESVSDFVVGNVVTKLKDDANWIKVGLPDGREGYVRAGAVMELEKYYRELKPTPEALIQTAKRFVGFSYTWGGVSPKGFDCSGFTRTLYKINGIKLPRDANMQVKVGTEVTIDPELTNLKCGDLIFWGRTAARVTHVGIYAGNKEFYHSDGIVRHESFDPAASRFNEFRRNNLVAARRIL